MKKTSAILILLSFCIQVIAKQDLFPPAMLGYYEGAGMGLYLDRDGLRMIDLGLNADSESRSERDPHFYTLSNQGLLLTKQSEENGISTYSTSSRGKHQHSIKLAFVSSTSLKIKIDQSPWKEFSSKQIAPDRYHKLFQLKERLDKRLFVEEFINPFDYTQINHIPESICGLWNMGLVYSLISKEKIISNIETSVILEIFRYGKDNNYLYLVLTEKKETTAKDLIALKMVNQQLFLQIFKESELVLGDREMMYKKERDRVKAPIDLLSWEKVREQFFGKYYKRQENLFGADFFSSFQIQEDGQVFIDGNRRQLVGITAIAFDEKVSAQMDSSSFSLMLIVYEENLKNEEYIQVNFNNGEIEFIRFSGKGADFYKNSGLLYEKLLSDLLIVLAIFLGLLLLFYRIIFLPRKLKQRLSQVQLEGIKSQLNPHFLFNSISSIQSLMNQGKTEEANIYLNDFSDLLRYHLDEGAEDFVLLSEELAALQHYCQLEQLRSPFQLEMEVDTQLDPEQIEIPNQILQIVVENAIKHGLRFSDNPRLNIRLQKIEQLLRISILDNGPGIHNEAHRPSKNLTIRKTHKGLELIHEKIKLLKKKGIKLNIDIKDRRLDLQEDERGTRVTLDIPLTY